MRCLILDRIEWFGQYVAIVWLLVAATAGIAQYRQGWYGLCGHLVPEPQAFQIHWEISELRKGLTVFRDRAGLSRQFSGFVLRR